MYFRDAIMQELEIFDEKCLFVLYMKLFFDKFLISEKILYYLYFIRVI